jgi:hypothetical protein
MFFEPLLSNGSCIFAYFEAVAKQRIYIPQYVNTLGFLLNVIHTALSALSSFLA